MEVVFQGTMRLRLVTTNIRDHIHYKDNARSNSQHYTKPMSPNSNQLCKHSLCNITHDTFVTYMTFGGVLYLTAATD